MMSINIVAIIILAALAADRILHAAADVMNLRHGGTGLPEAFKDYYDAERYRKSIRYTHANTRFQWVSGAFTTVVFLGFWFAGGFPVVDGWVRHAADSEVVRGLLFIGALVLARGVISLPFSVYKTFWIESEFGFNRTTPAVFAADTLKALLLGIVIGGIVLSAILAFFVHAGDAAWLYCWVAAVLFMAAMQFIVPSWIMPLFNRFEPLEPGSLRDAIFAYAEKIDFPVQNIYVMDGSKRSGKSNAFFAGFGKSRKIVLYDTLVENHTTDELVAVLAHEMGHFRKKHVQWMLLASILQAGVLFYLLSVFITSPLLAEAFFLDSVSVYAGLVFFAILYSPVDMVMDFLMQAVSRKNEYAADRFAVETTDNPDAMKRVLKKLAANNLAALRPHPFYVVLNYSHPPVAERIAAIDKMAVNVLSPKERTATAGIP